MLGTVQGRKQFRWKLAMRPMINELTITVSVRVVTTTTGIRTMAQSSIRLILA